MSPPLRALAELPGEAWLVGGAVRDDLLHRPTADCDVVVSGDPRCLARTLARTAGAHAFALSEDFGAWRVAARDRSWQVDLLPLGDESIEADLSHRDLTINAIARPLRGGACVDPFGGRQDLCARRLRMVAADAFARDPLRSLRLARLHCELGFVVDPATAVAAEASAAALAGVAPERIFAELRRILVAQGVLAGLTLMDSLGVTDAVLPELAGTSGHAVLAATIELERDPGRWFPDLGESIGALLAEPLADELSRGEALRLGALLHEPGAETAKDVLARLRTSVRLSEHVAALVRHHQRLGLLVGQQPLGRRTVYSYLRACGPVGVDATLLSVAGRLARGGRDAESAVPDARELELARALLPDALAWRAERPRPPVRGDELARAVGLAPGPELGRILGELEQACFAGEIATREQAIERARKLLRVQR